MTSNIITMRIKSCITEGIEHTALALCQLAGAIPESSGNYLLKITTEVHLTDLLATKTLIKTKDPVVSCVAVNFDGLLEGSTFLFLNEEDSKKIIESLNHTPIDELDQETRTSTLTEVGNISCNNIIGTLSNSINQGLHFSPPSYDRIPQNNILRTCDINVDSRTLICKASFKIIEDSIDFVIIIKFSNFSWNQLICSFEESKGISS